ncbi:MAG: S8 family serine peptidase [candidate division Zixibacteria bacterium]|nr:S8 family serine peptidase [candidate division Zixibacteria bacterium]
MGCGKSIAIIIASLFILSSPIYGLYFGESSKTGDQDFSQRIVVKLKPDIVISPLKSGGTMLSLGVSSLDRLNRKNRIQNVDLLFSDMPALSQSPRLKNILIVEAPAEGNIEQIIKSYRDLPEVVYAHSDYKMELHTLPNDPLFDVQWPLLNAGQEHYHIVRNSGYFNDELIMTAGQAGADINAQPVFENPPENTYSVIVAVIDTGVDTEHPELVGKIWTNPNEIAGNSIDDDHNGFVDDISGWDFTGEGTIGGPLPDNDPMDWFGHGTHCAGIIAATANNGIGIAGAADNCVIMPLKIFPLMLSSFAAEAIVYAADNGADVINMSFGYPWHIEVLEDALAYANSRGVVLCASAGNDGGSYLNFPAGSPYTMAVSASNSSNKMAAFSTYGDHISVCAPGEAVLSLRANESDIYAEYGEPDVHIISEDYYIASGTSMSGPHVAAVSAWVRAVSPGLVPGQVQSIIENTSTDILSPLENGPAMPGWDKYTGFGCVNLSEAVQAAPIRCARIESPANHQLISGTIQIHGVCNADDVSEFILEYGKGDKPESWTEFASGNTAPESRNLGELNTIGLNGIYSIRAKIGESNIAQVSVVIANSCLAEISKPLEHDTVHSQISIEGSAICPDFDHYQLLYASAKTPSEWHPINSSTRSVEDGRLGQWHTSLLDDGDYILKLSLYTSDREIEEVSIPITITSPFSGEDGWRVALPYDICSNVNYADLNGDGTNEILVGSNNGLYIFNPDGSYYSDDLPWLEDCDCRTAIAVGNIDHHSREDFATIVECPSATGSAYLYLRNSATGQHIFPLNQDLDVEAYESVDAEVFPYAALRDIDADGLDEIIVSISRSSRIYDFDPDAENIYQISGINDIYLGADLNSDGFDEFYAATGNMVYEIRLPATVISQFNLNVEDKSTAFKVKSLSAVDIDNDHRQELIVFGFYDNSLEDHWVYAFDEDLQLKEGWPHNTGINSYLVPPNPVFFNLDRDDDWEYYIATFELSQGQVYGWNTEGLPQGALNTSPVWAWTENPSILSPPVIADMDGDSFFDLISGAKRDVYHTYKVERIAAWDKEGKPLDEWPMVTSNEYDPYLNFGMHIPTIGDIDKDGFIDMVVTSPSNEVMFMNFDGVPYTDSSAPVPMWRYNKKLNNVCDYNVRISINVEDIEHDLSGIIPENFELHQNYPNPFNPSTRIAFALPQGSQVTFRVLNILGQTIEEKNLGYLEAGYHAILWNAEKGNNTQLPSGIYFYQIRTEDAVQSKKMLLLK